MITEFYRPRTVEEALALQKQGGVFLAGGTQINRNTGGISAGLAKGDSFPHGIYPGIPDSGPAIRAVYLDSLGLKGVAELEGGGFRLGALTTLQEIADNPGLPECLRQAAGFIPSRSVRNMATLGGNIGAAQNDSYLLPVLLVLDARLHLAGAGEGARRVVLLEEYLSRKETELILEVEIPPVRGVCFAVKESRSHVAPPYVSAGIRLEASGGEKGTNGVDLAAVRVALGCGCLGPGASRMREVERLLEQGDLREREDLEAMIRGHIAPLGDIWGSREYKSRVNAALTAGAILKALSILKTGRELK